ncbi:MAG: hypothetical protein EOP53_23790 [Sphingobacteriales bacterium]|nr:MAG: hypothetical protein EOP53_23790 [Sphingobacteriales bacterium]
MKIVVLADEVSFDTIRQLDTEAAWVRITDEKEFALHADADAWFDLSENAMSNNHPAAAIPLFIHAVTDVLPSNKKAIRINAWKGFLENESWEVAGELNDLEKAILSHLNKNTIICANEPGFISARIIAMIINEAYYAKGENVSTEAEIDTAMKLGTNYPYGPFEWAQKIGVQNIYALLKKLSLQDSRYNPAPLLIKTAAA